MSTNADEIKAYFAKELRDLASEVDAKQKDINISNIRWASAGLMGSFMLVAGLYFGVPYPQGFTVAGAALNLTSGIGNVATSFHSGYTKRQTVEKARSTIEKYNKYIEYKHSIENDEDVPRVTGKQQGALNKKMKSLEMDVNGDDSCSNEAIGQSVRIGSITANVSEQLLNFNESASASAARAGNTMTAASKTLKYLRVGGNLLSVYTIPHDLHTIVSNGKKVNSNGPSKAGEKIRKLADMMEEREDKQ